MTLSDGACSTWLLWAFRKQASEWKNSVVISAAFRENVNKSRFFVFFLKNEGLFDKIEFGVFFCGSLRIITLNFCTLSPGVSQSLLGK